MRLEQLQAFLAVAETSSFQKAAQRCGLTQSAVSRQIQALEAELGVSLFHRQAQVKLSIGGDRLLPRARKICQEWSTATAEIAELVAGKQTELCVAAMHSICAYGLPPVLQQFCYDYPEVQLRVTALGSDRSLKVLRDGLVDVAIVMNNRALTTTPEMVMQVLYDEPVKVLMSSQHPLAQRDVVEWQALAQYPQVVFKDGYGMQRIVQEQFERRGLSLRAVLELNTPDAFRGVVRQGEMLALLPDTALTEAYEDRTLAVRSIAPESQPGSGAPPLTRQVVVVSTRDRMEIPPIQHFYQLVCDRLPDRLSRSA
jgi:DNA-binding transcriptional LysR family regulator